MCGIMGYIGTASAAEILIDGLKTLEYRGYDSAGIAVYDSKLSVIKEVGRLSQLESKVKTVDVIGKMGIGHTRWASHGEPTYENAHPHTSGKIAVVHNGIIENHDVLRNELKKKKYVFRSSTDTEVVAHLVHAYMSEGFTFLDASMEAIKKLKGSYALAIVSEDNPDEIIVAKKDSPLILGVGENEHFIASDIPALIKYTRKIYLMEDDEIGVVKKDGIIFLSLDKQPIQKETFTIKWDMHSAERNGYSDFMLKEIHEQPQVILNTLYSVFPKDVGKTKINIDLDENLIKNLTKLYIVGCGTAYHSGLVGKAIIEKGLQIPVECDVASEFRYKEPLIDEHTLMIVISQSGETADTLAALRMAKKQGVFTLAIVNVVGSSIAREADSVIYTVAGPEIAVASTKAYSAQLVILYVLSLKIAQILDKVDATIIARVKKDLYELPDQVQSILEKSYRIEVLAEKYMDMKNIFYLGRGLDYLACMEGALKLKEIAYIYAESYPAGELKHGPIALIEKGTVLFSLLYQDNVFVKMLNNLQEAKARGASVIGLMTVDEKGVYDEIDDVIQIPKTNWAFSTLLVNIPQQLFAYYIAKGLGCDVDKPRNLAKSVTIE